MTEHRFAPHCYAEVRINGARRFIEVLRESGNLVIGTRVNRDGTAWEKTTATHVQTNLIVTHKDEVIRRMRLNLHYGMLEAEK